jgi:hypothetical protein
MNGKTGRVILVCCGLCAVAGVLSFGIMRSGGVGAAPQALTDVGRFRVGAALGEERAGFSGRAQLMVFASADDPGWSALQACLTDPTLEAELSSFTPVLIDERVDIAAEEVLRQRDSLRVVVRGLNGKFLGGLAVGFRCDELVELLRSIGANTIMAPDKSPIYSVLLRTSEPIDSLMNEGQRAQAERFVEFLREFEGGGSPAVVAAESRLNR